MNFKKNSLTFIKIFFGAVLLIYLFMAVDLKESLLYFNRINRIILIPLLLYIPSLIIASLRWKDILDSKKSLSNLFKISWISAFFSNFLPTIAGDSYKVIKLRKEIGTRKVIESVFFDRFSGILGILIVAFILSIVTYDITNNLYFLIMPSILILATILGFIFISFVNINVRYYSYLQKIILEFRKKIPFTIFLSVIYLLLGAASLWAYYWMFGASVNFWIVVSFYSLIQIISLLPISINSLGLREGSIVYLFSLVGINPELSLAVAIISRLVGVLQSAVGGLLYLINKN